MANTIFNNVVLENKYNSILATKLDLQRFMTALSSPPFSKYL